MNSDEEVARLREELAKAQALIAHLQAELEGLRKQLAEHDHDNVSFSVKPNTTKSKDKAGKQPRRKRAKEHNGARRRDTPTQTVQHKFEQCPTCAYPLRHARLTGRRQVIELPPPQPVEIIEHQLYKSWCARCKKWHYAQVDLSGQVIGHSRIGVRVASLLAYLRTSLRLPVRLIREYLLTLHNLLLSTGEIADLLHRVAECEAVQKATGQIHKQVRNSPIVHGDETVWREEGQNGYVWLFATPQGERYYEFDKSRAGAVARRILGAEYKGTVVSDFYGGYNDFPGEHQRCWAHLLRDLHALKEEHKENEQVLEWAAALRKLYDEAQALVRGPAPPAPQQREAAYHQAIESTGALARKYASAKEHAVHPCHTLCKRLLRHQDELFRFVLQPGLPADNNLAERSVRPVVVMRKVSGGSQSERGSRTRMTLASLFGTWRAKGLNPFSECLFLISQPLTP